MSYQSQGVTFPYEIEYEVSPDEYQYIQVEMEAHIYFDNDSFSYAGTHCTNGRAGTVSLPDYPVVEEITFDKEKHPAKDIARIEKYIEDNFDTLAENFIDRYEKMK